MGESKSREWKNELQRIPRLTDEDYSKYGETYYNGFSPNSGQEGILEWITVNFKTYIEKLAARLSSDTDIGVRVLGVGSGRGI